MKSLKTLAFAIPLASVMLFAQDQANRPDQGEKVPQADKAPAPAPAQADRPSPEPDQAAPQAERSPSQTKQTTTEKTTTTTTGQADRPSGSARAYTGTIVNASCSQASALKSAPGSYAADRTSTASTTTTTKTDSDASSTTTKDSKDSHTSTTISSKGNMKSIYDLQRDVMKHCEAKKDTAAFALVTDDGQFLTLDDAGNTQVKSNAGKSLKNMKVSVSGTASGDNLQVASLTRTDAAK